MVYPRAYPTGSGDNKPDENDYNAIVAAILGGKTTTGYIAYPHEYTVRNISGVYDAIDSTGNVVAGGADDAGGVDGDSFGDVLQSTLVDGLSLGDKTGTIIAPGIYTVDKKVTMYAYNSIRGVGAATYLVAPTNLNDYFIDIDDTSHDNHIEYMRFYGNCANQSGDAADMGIIYANDPAVAMYDVFIENCQFFTWKGAAIRGTGLTHSSLQHLTLDSYGSGPVYGTHAIYLANGLVNRIHDIHMERVPKGIYLANSNRTDLSQIFCAIGAADVTETAITFDTCTNCSARGVHGQYLLNDTVLVGSSNNITVSDVLASLNTGNAVYLSNSDDCTVSNITSIDSASAVRLGENSLRNSISNVTSSGTSTEAGVYIGSGSNYNLLTNINTYVDAGTGISDSGTGNKITNSYNKTTFIKSNHESSGGATLTAGLTEIAVAHGLAGTPRTGITLQTDLGTIRTWAIADATNITFYINTAAAFNIYYSWVATLA